MSLSEENNPNVLGSIYTFNSPGISADMAGEYRPTLSDGAVHYVTNGDLVSMAGHQFLTGDVVLASFQSDLAGKHVKPVLMDSYEVLAADGSVAEVRTRAPDIEFQSMNTLRLNSPYYFHTDRDYFWYLGAAYAATQVIPALKPFESIPPALVFRHTTEELRSEIGAIWHELVDRSTEIRESLNDCNNKQAHVQVPEQTFTIRGQVVAKASALNVFCRGAETYVIQGVAELPQLYNAKADLSGDNYVELNRDGLGDLKGEFTAEHIPVVTGYLEMEQVKVKIDTTTELIGAEGLLRIVP